MEQKQMWIVKKMVRSLPKARGYTFYLDKEYSSLRLARWLQSKGHHFLLSVGMSRPSWLFADGINRRAVPKGEMHYAVTASGSMAAATWHDRKPFTVLTDLIDPRETEVRETILPGGKVVLKTLPRFAHEYRSHYHLVDLVNQQTAQILFNRRCHKWSTHTEHGTCVGSLQCMEDLHNIKGANSLS